MKLFVLFATAIMTFHTLCAKEREILTKDVPAKADALSNPIVARSLANACEIVRLINELRWNEAGKKLHPEEQKSPLGIALIKPQSSAKDWSGIGAYRGSDWDPKAKKVIHRFSYGHGRMPAHQVWITYSYHAEDYEKPSIQFLGW